jgi:glycosyltransferase involved in cell wall biosynthesis
VTRVLTVARWYPSHDSPGRGSFVADLVRSTVDAGVDARVVSFDRVLVRGALEERDAVLTAARAAFEAVAAPSRLFTPWIEPGAPGVPVARLPMVRRPGSGDATALIGDHLAALRPFLRRLSETWRPDVIHAHTGLPDGIVAAVVGRELGIPVVVTEHMSTIETELEDPIARSRYRELLEPGVRLLGVSPSVAARVAALLDMPGDRIGVLPNPVPDADFPLADPGARDADELVWVGSLGEHKGIDVLLEAFAQLRAVRPGLRLRLVGGERSAGDRERWEALATALGVRLAVTFDGWLPRDRVASILARAAVFVHPSPSETFGVAAAEAILTGLPVAARRSGGVPWIIDLSGGFGHVANGDDPAAFAEAIRSTLDEPLPVDASTARARLSAAVGERAVAGQALAVYEAAIETAAVPAAPPGPAAGRRAAGVPVSPGAPNARPSILLATGRDHAIRLAADLPVDLQRELVLVVPAPLATTASPTDDPTQTPTNASIRVIAAGVIPPPRPRPHGRSPVTRLRAALWRPPPTGEELLVRALLEALRRLRRAGGPLEVVALDAPAAALVARLDPGVVRLAPGGLRWLADRWSVEPRPEGPAREP